jgi:class 3 adenylate cyclase/tetratricopeptide (TPR) repeat protein
VDIAAWLRELGLERYEQAFQEGEIDREVLADLTDADLRELGIPVGPRRKLLKAISALAAGTEPPSAREAKRSEAERRQLTVMFVDLVGSTELAARLDPEDLRDVMRAYQAACAEVIGRFEGHVAKYLGDGVLAYFGWPRAHEDDAERAVRAGLALAEAVGGLAAQPEARLQARVGIATGHVVVGDIVGEGASREEAVVGDVPNLAARLQALAEPGTVVIGHATRRLLGGLFQLEDLGPQRLKGFTEPLAAWRISGESPAEGRFEARHTAGLTPLVGRKEEIALLLRRWEQAREGEGQVVLLSGEPGIGKSRIVRELHARLEDEPHVRLLYQCSPHHATSPLHPLIEQLERAAGFARDDPPAARLDKLEALLARATERLEEAVPLIAAVLGVPVAERHALPEVTPQRQKQRTLEVLVDQLEGLAAAQPVLVTYEDVHWIDPTTQELLGLAIERIRRLQVLAIITFRPDFMPPWSSQPHVSTLALTRLGRRESSAMVDRVVGHKALPAEVSAQIVAKTDGVPLFVEELTKAVLESGVLKDTGEGYELSGPLPPLAIPSTLHDSLLARLDRLAPVKEVAQIGAAIGRKFSHALLAAVSPLPPADLSAALDQLLQSELIFRRGAPPEVTYFFKHALVQDAAYESLLKSKRRQLHARIARRLEGRFPGVAEAQPEVLAHHLTEAGLWEPAITSWDTAGRRAVARFANREAIGHFTRALELLEALPEGEARERQELRLRVALTVPLIAVHGFGSPEVEGCASRAKELSDRLGDAEHRFAVARALWNSSLMRRPVPGTLALSAELLQLAQAADDPAQLAVAHRSRGYSLYIAGRFDPARDHLVRGIELADVVDAADRFRVYGEHPAMVCRAYAGEVMAIAGEVDLGAAMADEAVAVARRSANPHSVTWALAVAAKVRVFRREAEAVRARAEEAIGLAREHCLPQWLGLATSMRGWALAEAGDLNAGIAEMELGRGRWHGTGAALHSTMRHGLLAAARLADGDLERGRADLRAAFAHLDRFGERYFEAELHRIEAAFRRREGAPPEDVEAVLRRAMNVAEGQGARVWQLRAATDLARLWRDQGKRSETPDVLAPVYDWFTEGFDTADLKDAKALLEELA